MKKKKKVVFVISGVLLAIAIVALTIYINRKNQFTNSVEVKIKPDR